MDNKKLEEIANQLREPTGEKGIEMANMMHETNINMTLQAIEQLAIQPLDVILELGHGNGKHIPNLLKLQPQLTYYGLEISALMYQEAKANNSTFINQQVFLHLYDGIKTPFENDFFNKLFTVNTIYFWEDPITMLAELYRITKPNGILAITFAQAEFMKSLPFTKFNFQLYDTEKLKDIIHPSGFEVIAIDSQTEMVRSKTNELVEREYTTLSLRK